MHRSTQPRLSTPMAALLAFGFALAAAAVTAPAQEENKNPASSLPADGAKPASEAIVWGALIFAADTDTDADPASSANKPEGVSTDAVSFEDLSERLAMVFPKKDFTLLGEHTQDIFREYESWVVPSKDLFLKIDSKGRTDDGGLQLHLQLWRDKEVLVKTDAILKSDSPLFIGGPTWRDGRLILVVMLAGNGA